MRQWISLCGYAQAGKDTVAQILVERYGYTRVAFADPLKELALEANPYVHTTVPVRLATVVSVRGWEAAKAYPDVRNFLQDLGVGVRNVLGENVWRDKGIETAVGVSNGRVVFTDSRFENELNSINHFRGKFIHIIRPNTGPANEHVSESEWGQWLDRHGRDATLNNDSTIDVLDNRLTWIMDRFIVEWEQEQVARGFTSHF